jgi:hypothetical protein
MDHVWKVFRERKDIEMSFIVSAGLGLMILAFAVIADYEPEVILALPVLVVWGIATLYFIVAMHGFHRSHKT